MSFKTLGKEVVWIGICGAQMKKEKKKKHMRIFQMGFIKAIFGFSHFCEFSKVENFLSFFFLSKSYIYSIHDDITWKIKGKKKYRLENKLSQWFDVKI